MKTLRHFFRIAIDLDPALNPIGSHLEVRTPEERLALVVRPSDGPFDSPSDVLRYCLDDVVARYGVPLEL